MTDEPHTFERYVVTALHKPTGSTLCATEDDYVDLVDAALFLVALSKRDAGAAVADMSSDDEFEQVTVHRLILGPALGAEEVNELFES